MKNFNSLGRLLAFLLLFGLVAVLPQKLRGQSVEGQTVTSIDVKFVGPQTIAKERVLANLRTKVGQPYSETTVEGDIRGLYDTGKLQNVRIFGEPVGNGVHVEVIIATRALMTEIEIDGAKELNPKAVRKKVDIKLPSPADADKLEEGRQNIIDYYESKGFPNVDVQLQVVSNEEKGTARAVYTINEGQRGAIRDIEFQGNHVFSDARLRQQMKTKKKTWISFLDKSGRLDSAQLQQDLDSVRAYYQNHGYIDVAIPEVRQERTRKGLRLVVVINEGIQYHVRKLSIVGEQVTTEAKLRSILKMKEGAVYSPEKLEADTKAMNDGYGAGGYVDIDIRPQGTSAGTGLVDLSYTITEGSRSFVERVNITGNTRTKDKVIRREIAILPGDVFNTVRVDTSKKRLENLGYFERVQTFPQDTGIPSRKDLEVEVQEKRTGSLQFGAGYSTIDSLVGFVEFSQGNFDITNYPAFTGGGEKFRARVQYGSERQDYSIALTEPYFLDYRLSLGGEIYYHGANFLSSAYDQIDYGFSLEARTPITTYSYASLTYRLDDFDITNIEGGASPQLLAEEGYYLQSEITPSFVYDSRDNVFLSRHGQRIIFTPYVAGGFLGGDVQIYGFDLQAAKYFLLPLDNIFLINGEIATVDTWGSGSEVPIFDRLFLGGANDLRGFDFRDVSPRDINGQPLGGKSLARLTIEETFPIIPKVRLAVFSDAGVVNPQAYDFASGVIAADVGIGVRLDLPIGPLRIDYGIPVSGSQYSTGGKFNFNVGYQF